ncbi:flagellar assembly protein FliW [Oceanobacillus caeni]|uniref:flagellar assembly protein FliW n=1 Tax=Oceanobacillus caeni TaxID=405946 RepID=UPI001C23E881|nr:flagellar assembly protein FliW [Oceanobacillus caeni]MBU8790310.1 flagellar assembly protein FliW [Oceanobacillus caeni]
MKLQTKYLGEIAIEEQKQIYFANGIPGFPDEKQFVLLDVPDNPVFQILQSVQSNFTAFFVINPFLLYKDYSFDLDDNTIETLQIKSENEVVILSIVTLKDPFHSSTINLKAPIVINSNQMLGKQYILNHEDYPSKASINPSLVLEGEK